MRLLRALPFAPFALAASVALAAAAAGVASAAEPTTPFGKWMKPNMGAPLAGQDFDTLQKSLTLVAAKPPKADGYDKWAKISSDGAAAAAKQDLAGVKASCKGCHDLYRDKYKKELPPHVFP
jgi:hypothetical protein